MGRAVLGFVGTTVAVVACLGWAAGAWGASSVVFAFLSVWLVMVWVATWAWVRPLRLPPGYVRLRPWEREGTVYRALGVGLAKRLLRRGPLTAFNPKMRGPHGRDPESRARLEHWMLEAEGSHAVAFLLGLGLVGHAAVRGWWVAAAWTLLFDVLVNGYPVALQRYNRAWLARLQS